MKLKIMDKKPDIPDDEIRQLMDFDGLIRQHTKVTAHPAGVRWTFLALGVIIVVIGTYMMWIGPDKKIIETHHLKQTEAETDKPVLKSNSNEIVQPPAEKQNAIQPTAKKPVTKPSPEKTIDSRSQSVYLEAEPLSGFPKFYEYLNNEIIYPSEIVKDSIQGVESVSFVIDEKGNLGPVVVLHSLGKPFDDEALRLLRQMPAWKPASLNGKPVASRISLPLTFTIRITKKEKQ